MKKLMISLFAVAAFASGCAVAPSAVDADYGDDAYSTLKNAKVRFRQWGTFQMENGIFKSPFERRTSEIMIWVEREFARRFYLDGKEYNAGVFVFNGGGTGYFYYFIVFHQGQTVEAMLIDDRPYIRSIDYHDGVFTCRILTHADGGHFGDAPEDKHTMKMDLKGEILRAETYAEDCEDDERHFMEIEDPGLFDFIREMRRTLYDGDSEALALLFDYDNLSFSIYEGNLELLCPSDFIIVFEKYFTAQMREDTINMTCNPWYLNARNPDIFIFGINELHISRNANGEFKIIRWMSNFLPES